MDLDAHVRVLCSNRLLRESIARILSKRTNFRVTTLPSRATVGLGQTIETEGDILVSDSLQLVQEVFESKGSRQGRDRPFRSVLVAMEDSWKDFLDAVKRGVLGYVLKEASAVEVVSAIRAVAKGEAVCPPQYTRVLFDSLVSQEGGSTVTTIGSQFQLTRREQQLIPLINQGWTNKEIANHLNLSEQTIKTHIHSMLRKVGARGRQGLSRVGVNQNTSTPAVLQS